MVSVVSSELEKVLVEQNHSHGLKAQSRSWVHKSARDDHE
jgi:hypothetical protein